MNRLLCLLFSLVMAAPLAAQPRFDVGERVPRFTVEMLDGRQVKISGCRGRVVLLTFWATWCKPCMKELAEVPEKIVRRFEGRDFTLIAIAKGEPRETVEKKIADFAQQGIVFPVGLDPYERICGMLGDERLPQLVVLDRRGVVRCHETGYTSERLDEVAGLIENLLNE